MWRIGLAFLAGHCCIHVLPALPAAYWMVVLAAAFACACTLRARAAAVFLVGIAWAWGNAALRIEDDLPAALEGEDVLVHGYVSSVPERNKRDVRFVFDVTESEPGVPERLQLTWYKVEQSPAAGEKWQLRVRLKRRSGFANPGGFDYEGHLFRSAIGATGYVRDEAENRRLMLAQHRYAVTQARAWLAQRMQSASGDHNMLGVLQGLAIGDTQHITIGQWEVFAATGTTHLMAISGLHISMVAALAAWFGGTIVRWSGAQARRWSAVHGQTIAGLLGALGYSLLAGLSVPTQRTLLMLTIYFAARWYRREPSLGNALGLALVVVLVLDPFAPLAAGAWLSFGAVVVIVLATSGHLIRENAFASFSRVQWAITIGLLPLLLAAFGSVSLLSPLANAVAVPVFTLLVVPLVLLGTLVATWSLSVGGFILDAATVLLKLLWIPLQWLADQPFAMWHFPAPNLLSLGALFVGAILLVLPTIGPLRVLAVLLCAQVFLSSPPRVQRGEFELALVDVGQGLAAVVRTHTHVLVYDTGPAFQSGRNAADFAVLPYLRFHAVRRIDTLLVSHGDLDHRGGMESLLEAVPVTRLLLGPSLPSRDGAERCAEGQRWTWDDVEFEILHPASGAIGEDNDTSCVLLIRGPGGGALLTGDIEEQGERELLQSGKVGLVDIVVAPHHGSRTSSGKPLVETLAPSVALFSAGYRNRWGMPHPSVVQRWQAAGARTFTTAQSGAIEIRIARDSPMQVREYRRTNRHYWTR